MNWIIAAPYLIDLKTGFWKEMGEGNELNFICSPPEYIHSRSRKYTGMVEWLDYSLHTQKAWKMAQQYNAGIFTNFPQLAVLASLKKRVSRYSPPLIAGTFNLGGLPTGYKQRLSKSVLNNVDKFIVHSRHECHAYSEYFSLPLERFEFIPLHRPVLPISFKEDIESPFILAVGSAKRDYLTLINAVKRLNYNTVIVTPKKNLDGIKLPSNVSIKTDLSISECRQLVQKACINIIPLNNKYTASGQVTVIEAMMLGKAIIATNSIGTEDYLTKETGILIEERNVESMCEAISFLWENSVERKRLGDNAKSFALNTFTEKQAAIKVSNMLNYFN